ncbi:uridine kinase [Oscillochloris sp. ZM17-4]|uniref:uridine kinase n=1 Tax=Oscillochloris sp. ZM17-4 TaxID=2866714 RepID=UPI001C731A93|nr:uridine kinase [Oscillochloris sp. ZM17-4]MBX0326524.1 uridine kinase [Oscillochloris sp. ZM17-4]
MNTNLPLMLGIVGDGGTGKTTLVRGVVRILGINGVTPICLDDYHRYNRVERLARGLTDSNPDANDLGLMAEHLLALRAGGTIQKPVYDHRKGVLRPSELVAATGLVIAYGMFTLTPPDLADLFDLTVYLEPDDDLRHSWRFQRDTQERGYAAEQVLALRPANDDAALRYISGQRRYAGLVVRFHVPEGQDPHDVDLPQMVDLLLRHAPATAPLEPFLSFIERGDLPHAQIDRGIVDEDGRASDRIRIDAALDEQSYGALLDVLWPASAGLPELPLTQIGVLGAEPSLSRSRSLALVQVIVASLLARAPR